MGVIISIISFVVAAAKMTTVIVKLETINASVSEIKADVRNTRTDLQEIRDRLIIVEQSAKSAHHRLDVLEGKGTMAGSSAKYSAMASVLVAAGIEVKQIRKDNKPVAVIVDGEKVEV